MANKFIKRLLDLKMKKIGEDDAMRLAREISEAIRNKETTWVDLGTNEEQLFQDITWLVRDTLIRHVSNLRNGAYPPGTVNRITELIRQKARTYHIDLQDIGLGSKEGISPEEELKKLSNCA